MVPFSAARFNLAWHHPGALLARHALPLVRMNINARTPEIPLKTLKSVKNHPSPMALDNE